MTNPSNSVHVCTFRVVCTVVALFAISACGESDGNANPQDSSPLDAGSVCFACEDTCEERLVIGGSLAHQEGDLGYGDPPPAGGTHNGCWASWGVHEQPVRPENWVHNLEHGGVVLLYNCDDCSSDIEALSDFGGDHGRALVTPYPAMTARFAAIAWGYRLLADCLDIQAVAQFYETHAGSPEAPEPNVTTPPPPDCL